MRALKTPPAAALLGLVAGGLGGVLGCGGGDAAPPASTGPVLPPTPAQFVGGQTMYDANCSACHDVSQEGAPRLGFKRAWDRRIEQGADVMVRHVIEGYHEMPPRGDNPDLTDDQIAAIVDYMVYRAGLDIPAGYK